VVGLLEIDRTAMSGHKNKFCNVDQIQLAHVKVPSWTFSGK